MNAKRVAAIGWMIVVLFTIPTSSIAHEGKSPGFDAAWAEVTKDGRLLYHCLVDLENCEADQLDLVMQFLFAGLDDSNVKERGADEPLMLFPQTWQRTEVAQENSRRWKPEPVELQPSLFAGAELKPGTHEIDAIFDLYDVKAKKYVAGGWPWRLTLLVKVAADGTVVLTRRLPNDSFIRSIDPKLETKPPVVVSPTPMLSDEPIPRELSAYELKFQRLFGSMRLRHGNPVSQLAFSKDGSVLISVGEDGGLCLWKCEQGSLRNLVQGTLLTANDGTLLVLDSTENTTVLDPAIGRTRRNIQEAPDRILAAGLPVDCTQLILLNETIVGQWDLASGERIAQHPISIPNEFRTEVTGSISRCGRFAVLACNSGKVNNVTVFEVGSGRKVLSTSIDYGDAPNVEVCSNGKLLVLPDVTRNGKHNLAIFDAVKGEKLRTFEIGYSRCKIAISPNSLIIAAVDNSSYLISHLNFYDPNSGDARRVTGPGAEARQLAFSPDGRSLAVVGGKGAEVVDVDSGQVLCQWDQPASAVAYSSDGLRLATGDHAGRLEVRDATTGSELVQTAGLSSPVSKVVASADGRSVAACTQSGACRVWDATTGLLVFSTYAHRTTEFRSAQLDLSPDGRRLVTGAPGGGDPLVWDVAKGQIEMSLRAGGLGVNSVAFSPDGLCIAACHDAGDESCLGVWDLSTRQSVIRDPYWAQDVVFSRDGNWLFATGRKSLEQYNWREKQPKLTVATWDFAPTSVACSADGKLIACAGQILDAKTGRVLAQHEPLSNSDMKYLFAPNGLQLLVVAEGKLSVFEPTTGKLVRTIAGPWRITAANFTADGKTLLTGLANGAVVAWQW